MALKALDTMLEVHPRIISAMKKAKLNDYTSILSMSTPELISATKLCSKDINTLQLAVARAVPMSPVQTGLSLYNRQCPVELQKRKLTTGCQILDQFLKGGLICPGLLEIAGESASGKTQLCMQLCLMIQLPAQLGGHSAGAVYICTEDVFPNRRLMQMVSLLKQRTGPTVRNINFTDNIFIEHISEIEELQLCLHKKLPILLKSGKVKLVIVDSIAALFRSEYGSRQTAQRAKILSSLAAHLHKLSSQYGTWIVCVNQVSALMHSESKLDAQLGNTSQVTPALGLAWANLVTVRLMLRRTHQTVSLPIKDLRGNTISNADSVVRSMEVVFAPHLPNQLCHYVIDHEGVKGIR